MLDAIFDAVKGQVVNNVTEKTGLDAGQAEQTVPLAKESITEELTSAVSGGNIGGILDMVRGASGAGASGAGGSLLQNTVYQGIASNFIGKLTSRLGLPAGVADKVAAFALPLILGKIAGRTREAGPTDDINESSLMDALGLDAGGMLGNVLGGNKEQGGGGLGGMLGGMLK